MKKPQSKMTAVDHTGAGEQQLKAGSTLDQIRPYYDASAFQILLHLVLWARLWDQLYKTDETQQVHVTWDDATVRVMLSPFVGFGNNPRLWTIVTQKVAALIGRETPLWLGDPAYRKANTMVWCVLQTVAPSLAAESTGLDGQNAVVGILAKGFIDDQ